MSVLPADGRLAYSRAQAADALGGGVYFIEGAGLIKIGVSGNVAIRFRDLQHSCPIPLYFRGYIPGADEAVEWWLHHRYDDCRQHGEWFAPNDELRQLVAGDRPDLLKLYTPDQAAAVLPSPINATLVYELARADLLPAIYRAKPRTALRFAAVDIDEIATRLADFLAERAVGKAEKGLLAALAAVRGLQP